MNDIHQSVLDQLSDYIDDELDPRATADIQRHLAACASCRAVEADLRRVIARAGSLVDTAPDQDLWSGVASRIGRVVPFQTRAHRRFSFTLPQIAAASLALMVLSGGMVWLAKSGDPRADFPVSSGAELAPVAPVRVSDNHYEGAVEDLQQALERNRAQLDPETVRVLEENLKTIDAAIEQCRQALDRDPSNPYLNSHLAAARQRKLALLRRATALTAGS